MNKLNAYPEVLAVKDIKQILRIGTHQTYSLVKSEEFKKFMVPCTNLYSKKGLILWLQGKI
ncbi:DNA-binding protein [Fictibacillus sp. 23RED33]|uniref:DNA-binding protein n=1 Tax=Fictibacillus sp. 23RED33 TaxID=2745879 RepID=UPI0018CE689E|nr:DNA-binding protein [Fictibacillus sp. 23RED33]MBH0175941.1 DNA-binding protein [Fictibacillus sp. 23RED33]